MDDLKPELGRTIAWRIAVFLILIPTLLILAIKWLAQLAGM